MNTLPLEVIEYIAKLDNQVWYKLVQVYKFLSEKTSQEDMKRKFLLCSTMYPNVVRNESIKYKYNKNFHITENNNIQCYVLVYYLPNGDLHTFEDPCKTSCVHDRFYLEIWFKDNKIGRDDNPSVIGVSSDYIPGYYTTSKIYDFPLFRHLYQYLNSGAFSIGKNTKMWFKNNNFYRDNDLPVITNGEDYKEWRKNNLLHRDNDLPAIIDQKGCCWYQNGKLHRDNDLPAIVRNNGSQDFYKNGVAIYGIMSNGSKIYYFPE